MNPRIKNTLTKVSRVLLPLVLLTVAFLSGMAVERARSYGRWRDFQHGDMSKAEQAMSKRLDALARRLDFTPEQKEQAKTIMGDALKKVSDVRNKVSPEIRDLKSGVREQLVQILTPEQKTKFEKMRNRWGRQKMDSEESGEFHDRKSSY